MMPETYREGHRARVAECAISATHNSLKSQRTRNLKSPFSNNRAVASKLCIRSRPTAVKNHTASNSCAAVNSHEPAAPSVHFRPRFRALAVFGRRPPEHAGDYIVPGDRKPYMSANLSRPFRTAQVISFCSAPFGAHPSVRTRGLSRPSRTGPVKDGRRGDRATLRLISRPLLDWP